MFFNWKFYLFGFFSFVHRIMGKLKRDHVQKSSVATVRERQNAPKFKPNVVKKMITPAAAATPSELVVKRSQPSAAPALPKSSAAATTRQTVLQKIPDLPVRLVDPRDTVKRQSKKDKLKERRDRFKRKFDTLDKANRQLASVKKAKKPKKIQAPTTPAVRSALLANFAEIKDALPTLDDSLPSLNSLFQLRAKGLQKTGVAQFDEAAIRKAKRSAAASTDKNGVEKKMTKANKLQEKKNEFMQRCKHFKALTKDKTFKKNPREVIAMHIRNRQLANGVVL